MARQAGLLCSDRGGIVVSKTMQTSDPNIYAGGDCVVIENLVTGKPGYYPLGSMANRQGRVIGTNVAGGRETFEGGLGTFIVKIFDYAFAGTGLTLPVARREGFHAFSTQVMMPDHSHFYPKRDMIRRRDGGLQRLHVRCRRGAAQRHDPHRRDIHLSARPFKGGFPRGRR